MIEAKNLGKSYTSFKQAEGLAGALKSLFNRKSFEIKALEKVNFTINDGELIGLIGPNGAGKSTIIKILCGILFPTSGTVEVASQSPWVDRSKFTKKIGAVFGQKSQLWFDLPPQDTYLLNKALYDIPEDRFRENLAYFTKLLDIKDVINRPTRQLSLGERMKCEFVAALLHDPQVLFLDEPTIGLDVIAKQSIRDFIKKINKDKKTTVILTTHDLSDIEELCERVLLLHKGKLLFDGKLAALRSKFGHLKTVVLSFKSPVKKFVINAKIKRPSDLEAQFTFDAKKIPINNLLKKVLSNYPVADITVKDPEIEDVIRKIYKEQ